jgi:GNAT superfamily N-acetyltransferase
LSPVRIRPAVAADHAAWLPLWQGYQAFYQTEIPAATTAETWRRLMDPSEPMACAVAEAKDGRLLGLVHTVMHRSTWTVGNYCYLQDLFVAQDTRGLGVGRALIEQVYREAQAQGCSRVHWLTHETNTNAMQLYDRIATKSGFVQYRHLLGG